MLKAYLGKAIAHIGEGGTAMGSSVALLALLGAFLSAAGERQPGAPPNTLLITEEGDSIWIRHGGSPLLRYRFRDVPHKPYVQEWYSPAGVNILRDAPDDHKHHHGLMFAIKVDGVNFWEEQEAPGTQVHRGFHGLNVFKSPGGDNVRLVQRLAWVDPSTDAVLLQEVRTITFHDTAGPALLTWESRFTVPQDKDKATLGGAHYHGLGMRFVESMDTVGTFTTPGGELGELVRGDEHLTPGTWCAYTAPVEGKSVIVALFDAPENARPALWFTMKEHFAYLSATINLWRDPLDVTPDTPLVLCYGAALWDGEVNAADIEATFQQWLKLNRPG